MSDNRLFWFFVLFAIFLAHYYLYVSVGVHLKGWQEALWLVMGAFAMMSSLAARRLHTPRRERRRMTLKSAVYRFGGAWNIFVILTTACMLIFRCFALDIRAAFLVSCCVSFAVCAYGVYEARTIRTVRIELRTPKLPDGAERLRIAQLTDLHISPFMLLKHVARVVDAIVSAEPDLVVITGDLVDGSVGDEAGVSSFYLPYAEELRRIAGASPRLGVWAVPGNHDYYEGFENSAEFVDLSRIERIAGEKRDLGEILLLGADDLDHIRKSDANPEQSVSEELFASLTCEERKKFVLFLRHRPIVEPSTIGRFDLQLSGHTHGGQLFFIPSSRHKIPGRPKGLRFIGNGSYLYVSNGAGFVGPPHAISRACGGCVDRLDSR
ncbi:metallophosphoesterase [Synergistaceae bacterium OttesenSCG-928-I11]|nr:metallophosphoesterase [Synergistaceae bacterium OttesenSCG-928-I11]